MGKIVFLFSIVLVYQVCFSSSSPSTSTGKILIFSDIHWNPLYSPHALPVVACFSFSDNITQSGTIRDFGQYGCDSSHRILTSALADAAEIFNGTSGPDFILITGDFNPHGLNIYQLLTNYSKNQMYSFMSNVLHNVTTTIQSAFPSTPVYPCLGNEDAFPDYDMPPGGNETLLSLYATSALSSLLTAPQSGISNGIETFSQMGSYRADVPNSKVTVLALNTNSWSGGNDNVTCDDTDPNGQFEWLQTQLTSIAKEGNRYVYLIGHIPPMAIFASEFFKDCFNTQFWQIVTPFIENGVIRSHFYGHIHASFMHAGQGETPIQISAFINGAITPITNTNPLYSIYEYNATGDLSLLSFRQRFFNLSVLEENEGVWKDLFVTNSNLAPISLSSLSPQSISTVLIPQLSSNVSLFEWYAAVSLGDGPSALPCADTASCQKQLTCGMRYNSASDVQNCINGEEEKSERGKRRM